MIKGFVFDMDGVLTETANLHYKAWANEVSKFGIELTEEENAGIKGLPRKDTLVAILKLKNKYEDFSEEQIEQMCEAKNNAYVESLNTSLDEKNILPGIIDFLKQAQSRGVKMGISSSSRNAPMILEKLNMSSYFDFITDPTSVANGKPAPDLYLSTVKGLGLEVDEAVGFEDAIAGVQGLVAGKIKTVAITWGDNHDWSSADIVIPSTKDLDIDAILKL